MKRLLLASILMAIGASAHAVVSVGTITCSGLPVSTTCTAPISCVGNCNTNSVLGEQTNCLPAPLGLRLDVTGLIADKEGPGPICVWDVTDTGDDDVTRVTIDSSDGLPVELQSLSVE